MDSSSTLPIVHGPEDDSKTYVSSPSKLKHENYIYDKGSSCADLRLCGTISEYSQPDPVNAQYSFQPENLLLSGTSYKYGIGDHYGSNQPLPLNENGYDESHISTSSLELGETGYFDATDFLPRQCQQIIKPQTTYIPDALNNTNTLLPATNQQSATLLFPIPNINIQPTLDPATPFPALPLYKPSQLLGDSSRQEQSVQPERERAMAPTNPEGAPVKVKRRRRRKPPPPPEVAAAKHKAFLKRNRKAAAKCRAKKKTQIDQLEAEERAARQQNAVMKKQYKDMLGEVFSLTQQIKEIGCQDDCLGCGGYASMRIDGVATLLDSDVFHEHEGRHTEDIVPDD